jgi:hypothetical protein
LREEHKLRVFENRVLGKTFGPKRDEVTGEWRRLHNEELNDLYRSLYIVQVIHLRIMRWAGHLARMGDSKGAYKNLLGRPEGKRPLRRPRLGWEDNIIMDLQDVRWGAVGLIDLAQGRAGGRLL